MKKILTLLCLLLSLSLWGCSNQEAADHGEAPDAASTMTIAAMPSVDKIPIIVAQEQGYFAAYGLTVNLENFQAPTDRNAALQGGKVDGVMSDMIADILYLSSDMDMKMTSLIQSDFVVIASASSGITSFAEITADHSIGVALSTLMEYIADQAGPAEKVMVPEVSTRVEQVLSGDIDLAVVPEPYGSMAVNRGAVTVGSAADLDIYAAVMLFPQSYLTENHQAVTAFYQGYNDAIAYLSQNGMAAVLDTVIAKGEFPETSKDALSAIDFVPLKAPTAAQFDEVQAWMNENPSFDGGYAFDFKKITDLTVLNFEE